MIMTAGDCAHSSLILLSHSFAPDNGAGGQLILPDGRNTGIAWGSVLAECVTGVRSSEGVWWLFRSRVTRDGEDMFSASGTGSRPDVVLSTIRANSGGDPSRVEIACLNRHAS